MNFNRRLAKTARRTAAVIGSGMAIGGAIAAPILAPLTNVYAADSYETEKTDYESKLAEAKKTTGLKVTEKTETVEVLESQLEAKKKELAEKTDAETAKLQAAIDKQKANNNAFDEKTKNPDVVYGGVTNENIKSEYSEEQIKELLTDKNGNFNFADVNDFSFVEITGFSSTAKPADKATYREVKKTVGNTDLTDESETFTLEETQAIISSGGDCQYVTIPEKGAKYIEENIFIDNKTGKAVDAIFTVTDFEVTEDPYYPVLIWRPRLGFTIGYGLKTVTLKCDFVEHGTTTPISIDIVYTAKDLDGMGSDDGFELWNAGVKFYTNTPESRKQALTFYQAYKTMLGKNSDVLIEGQTASGTKMDVATDSPEGWATFIARDISTMNIKWDDDIDTTLKLSANPYSGSTPEEAKAFTQNYLNERKTGSADYPFKGKLSTWAWIGFDGLGIISHENMPKRATSAVEVTKYEITTKADPQKGSVIYIDQTENKTLETKKLNGESNQPFNYNTTDTIKKYTDMGYELVSSDFPKNEADQKFDSNPNVDQDYTVILKQRIVNIPPNDPGHGVEADQLNKTIKRTVYYKYESKDGKDVFEPVVQTVKLTRSATKNLVTGETTFTPWTEGKMDELTTKAKKNYTFDRAKVDGVDPVKVDTKVNDEYVIYTKIPQKGSVKFTDKDTKEPIADTKKLNGHNEEPFGYTPDATIKKLEDKGYDLVSNDFPKDEKDQVYDTDPDVDQNFEVIMTPHIETITPDKPKTPGDPARPDVPYPEGLQEKDLNKTLTRTIYYKYDTKDGEDVFKPVKQTVKLTRTATFNYVTGEIKYSDWTTGTIKDVTSPDKENYTYDRSVVEGVPEVTTKTKLEDQYVIYKKIPQKGSVDFKDRDTGEDVAAKKKLDGFQAEPFNYTPDSTIKKLENNGWDLVSNDFPEEKADQVYDTDPETDQDYHVVLTPHIETITPDDPKTPGSPTNRDNVKYPEGVDKDDLNKTFSRTIYYKYETPEGEDVFEPVEQAVTLTRTATFNYVTGEVVYADWTTASIEDVVSPEKAHWQYDIEVVKGVNLTSESEPLEDVYVIYTKVPEKGKMEFTDEDGKPIADTHKLDGFDEEPFNYDPAPVLEDLHNKGWDLIENTYPEKPEDQVFDSDPNVDQDYKAVHTPHIETIKPDDPKKPGSPTDRKDVTYPEGVDEADLNKTFTRTIYFKYNDKNGNDVFEPVKQEVHLTREAKFNYVTGEVEYTEWTTALMDGVDAKTKDGYTFDRAKVDELLLTGDSEMPGDEFIIYTAIPEEAPVTPSATPSTPVSTPSVTPDTGNKDKTGIFAAIGAGAAAAIAGAVAVMKRRKKTEDRKSVV